VSLTLARNKICKPLNQNEMIKSQFLLKQELVDTRTECDLFLIVCWSHGSVFSIFSKPNKFYEE
jgi:hypothetical protein